MYRSATKQKNYFTFGLPLMILMQLMVMFYTDKFVCNGCAEKRVIVTEGCQGCPAHPCEEVCSKDAMKYEI